MARAAQCPGEGLGVRRRIGLMVAEDIRWIGGSIYLRNLVHIFASLPPRERPEIVLLGGVTAQSALVRHLSSFDFVRGIGRTNEAAAKLGRAGAWMERLLRYATRRLPRSGKSRAIDLEFPVFEVGERAWPSLYWIPDFQHAAMPQLFSGEELRWRDATYSRIAQQHGVLLLSSQAALSDFRHLFPDAVVSPRVWSFCSSLGAAEQGGANPCAKYGLPEKFLYVPNQFWVHKDHATVFRGLGLLRAKGIAPTVVCTGLQEDYRHPGHFRALMDEAGTSGVAVQIRSLGLVPREDQLEIFRHAAAVVQPSLFEGWSTVVEDTKSLGRPLIVSDIPPHLEQAAGAAHFFRAGSPEDLAQVLEAVWPRLVPGPDPSAERAGLDETARRRPGLARAFLGIVEEAITVSCTVRETKDA
jgi:glycosyltransferase involved in cell wall biosynthesis